MTKIIAGKLKVETFVMTDCIGKDEELNKLRFSNKLIKLRSADETYCCMTGVRFFFDILNWFDAYLASKCKESDFISGEKSSKVFEVVTKKFITSCPEKIKNSRGRFFIINKDDVVYYDYQFFYKENEPIFILEKEILSSGYYIDSSINFPPTKIDLGSITVEDYSFKHLKLISKGEDLKKRYSFLHFLPDKKIIKSPYHHFSDVISEYYGNEFSKIDNNVWDIPSYLLD